MKDQAMTVPTDEPTPQWAPAPTEQPTTPRRPRTALWIINGVALAGILIGGAVLIGEKTGPDAYAKAACAHLKDAETEGLFDGAMSEIKAIDEASKSSNAELRAAATKKTEASDFPTDSPLYQNPGDVQAAAIAKWCNEHM
jgi:hypothetical protein